LRVWLHSRDLHAHSGEEFACVFGVLTQVVEDEADVGVPEESALKRLNPITYSFFKVFDIKQWNFESFVIQVPK
jgi:hypothetical protein